MLHRTKMVVLAVSRTGVVSGARRPGFGRQSWNPGATESVVWQRECGVDAGQRCECPRIGL